MASAMCDVCSSPTSWEEGTGYTAGEFRKMVAKGFGPDEKMITMQEAFGATRQQAISQWKNGLVAQSTTGWLLCPSCAQRASRYMPKKAGGGPDGHVLTETISASSLYSSQTATSTERKWWRGKKGLIVAIIAVAAVIYFFFLK